MRVPHFLAPYYRAQPIYPPSRGGLPLFKLHNVEEICLSPMAAIRCRGSRKENPSEPTAKPSDRKFQFDDSRWPQLIRDLVPVIGKFSQLFDARDSKVSLLVPI